MNFKLFDEDNSGNNKFTFKLYGYIDLFIIYNYI